MDEKTVTFEEKLTQLLELAKSKKNVLENKEILDFFHGEILNPDQLDQIYDFLDSNKVDVLQFEEELEIDPDLFIEEELNVKQVIFSDDVREFTSYTFKPQLKTVGPRYGKLLNQIRQTLTDIDGSVATGGGDRIGKTDGDGQ